MMKLLRRHWKFVCTFCLPCIIALTYLLADIYSIEIFALVKTAAIILIPSIIFGCITSYVSWTKGYDTGFAWGFFLNVIGLLVVGLRESKNKPQNKRSEAVSSKTSDVNSLKELAALYKEGMLTEEEFKKEKEKIINK